MEFTITCNRCGSTNVYVSGDTYFEAHIECKDCDNYHVGNHYGGKEEQP